MTPAASPRAPAGRGIPARALSLAIAGIFALQLALAWGRMDLPFLDGRLHFNYDNALFSGFARSGILLGDARSQMGVTEVTYSAWGQPSGPPRYYTHHPFLFKTLFQLWVRSVGDSESTSRAFALLVSMIATAGAVVALTVATGSVLAAGLGTAVMVATPVFTTFQLCIKYELDGMAIGTWLMATVFLQLRAPTRAKQVAILLFSTLAVLAHWTAILLVGALGLWLAARWIVKRERASGRSLLALGAGTLIGGAALLAVFAWLRGGWAPFWRDQVAVLGRHQDISALAPGEWGERQRWFLGLNLTWPLIWIALALAAALAARWAIRRFATGSERPAGGGMLGAYFGCTLATALVWVFGFRQASHVHYFMQLWLVLPLGALVAAPIAATRGRRGRTLGVVSAAALLAWLVMTSTAFTRRVLAEQLGTREDITFLRSLREDRFERLVFIPITRDPVNVWFSGPIFDYYTARPVVAYDRSVTVGPGDKVLMLRVEGNKGMLAQVDSLLDIHLSNERCGGRLCAYDVRRP